MMHTMRTVIIAAVFAMAVPCMAWGQEPQNIGTPGNPPFADSYRSPVSEVSVSVGIVSGFGCMYDFFKVLVEGVANAIGNHYKTETDFIGTYGLDYYAQVKSWLRPGVKVVYEGLCTKVWDTTNVLVNKYYTTTLSFMPSVQFSYLNRRHVKLYSGIDLGVTFLFDNNKQSSGNATTLFALNATPIGVRFGNDRMFGLVETNLGMDALVKAGFGMRF